MESYAWKSSPNITHDSSHPGFLASGLSSIQINTSILEHTIYSSNKPESLT